MLPSDDDIASFLAFAPDAGEGKAFMYLEVNRSGVRSAGIANMPRKGREQC
jgi:hypothetical protein